MSETKGRISALRLLPKARAGGVRGRTATSGGWSLRNGASTGRVWRSRVPEHGASLEEAAEAIGVTILMNGGPATIDGPRAFAAFSEFHAEHLAAAS